MKKLLSFLACALMFVAATGCGGSKGLEGLKASGGTITLDGEPLPEASITLSPASGTGRGAGAMSDEKGKFSFQTLKAGDGIAPGDYVVTVTKGHIENPYTPEEQALLIDGKRHSDIPEFKGRPEPTTVSDIPLYYGNIAKSGLTLTIPEGGKKDLKIELSSEE